MKAISSEEEYKKTLVRIDELMNAEKGTPEGAELETLVHLVLQYEKTQEKFDLKDLVDPLVYKVKYVRNKTYTDVYSADFSLAAEKWCHEFEVGNPTGKLIEVFHPTSNIKKYFAIKETTVYHAVEKIRRSK